MFADRVRDVLRICEEIEAPFHFSGLLHLLIVSLVMRTPFRVWLADAWVDPVSASGLHHLADIFEDKDPHLLVACVVRKVEEAGQEATEGTYDFS